MNIKKANVNLLLNKVRTYLESVPPEKRKGKKYVEAGKALAKLEKLFLGLDGVLELKACRLEHPVIYG